MVLTETQTAIQDNIRDFARNEIRPNSAAHEQAHGYPPQLFTRLTEMGLMGMIGAFALTEADTGSDAAAGRCAGAVRALLPFWPSAPDFRTT